MKELILLSGKDCHLCEMARSLLLEIEEEEFTIKEVDIYSKRAYLDKYWDKIPVLISGNNELLWPFDSKKVIAFLDRDVKKIK